MFLFGKTPTPPTKPRAFNSLIKLLSITFTLSLLFSACTPANSATPSQDASAATTNPNKKTIYTTIYSVFDFTKKIAGDDFNLVMLMPPGTEAHDWEPGPQDMAKLSKADAFIFSGAGMEPWVDQVASVGSSELMLIDSSKNVPLIDAHADAEHAEDTDDHDDHEAEDATEHDDHDHEDDDHDHEAEDDHAHDGHDHGQFDPHIWLDPKNVKIQMQTIADALIQLDPTKQAAIEKRLKDEHAKLDALDKQFSEVLKPHAGKTIIVSHEAFAYLFKAYNLNQLGIEGLLASSEPSPGHMANLIKLAKTEKITVVYVEPLSSSKTAESLATEIGGRVEQLDPYEGLTAEEEAMGKDYYTVMEQNLKALLGGFDGE